MNLSDIALKVKNLSQKNQIHYWFKLETLLAQFHQAVALETPYRLLIDSSIILRFEDFKNGILKPEFFSILTFFEYFKRFYSFSGKLVIRPTIFYEYIRRQNVTDFVNHWQNFKNLNFLINETLQQEIFFENIETLETAQESIFFIEYDEKLIKALLNRLARQNWQINLTRVVPRWSIGTLTKDLKFKSPIDIAVNKYYRKNLIKNLSLKYFDLEMLTIIFKDYIKWYICSYPKNHQEMINLYTKNYNYPFKKIVKINEKKQVLKGLADLELLSLGNVEKQYKLQANNRHHSAYIPLTLDGKLNDVLWMMSYPDIGSVTIRGGDDINLNLAQIERYFFFEGKRLHKSKERQIHCTENELNFFDELIRIFQ